MTKKVTLPTLLESQLQKAELAIAAKGISSKFGDIYNNLSRLEANDLMPLVDAVREEYGPEAAEKFSDSITQNIRSTMDAVRNAKEAIAKEADRLNAGASGEDMSDMAFDLSDDTADLDAEAPAHAEKEEDDLDLGAEDGDLADLEDDQFGMDAPEGDDELGLDFSALDDDGTSAAGRPRKESVQLDASPLSESEQRIFRSFSRMLSESASATNAARAAAALHGVDLIDVIEIVKEGKTWKDAKGKSDKKKDFKDDRKAKNSRRKGEEEDLEEGKTWKDAKGKSDKKKDFKDERKAKTTRRGKEDELEECDAAPKKKASPVKKK